MGRERVILELDSRAAFTAVVALFAALRLAELRVARRNTAALLARGASEVGRAHYPWMVVLHSLFLVSCVAEVWLLSRPWMETVAAVALAVLVQALGLRWWTLKTLGGRWTTRILVVPGERLIESGPYRFMRHPNYVAVVLEIAALPMLHCAWLTAAGFTLANLLLLRVRISAEEGALSSAAATHSMSDGRVA
jgi:methyltransferase